MAQPIWNLGAGSIVYIKNYLFLCAVSRLNLAIHISRSKTETVIGTVGKLNLIDSCALFQISFLIVYQG